MRALTENEDKYSAHIKELTEEKSTLGKYLPIQPDHSLSIHEVVEQLRRLLPRRFMESDFDRSRRNFQHNCKGNPRNNTKLTPAGAF